MPERPPTDPPTDRPDGPDDEERLAVIAARLADAVAEAVGPWARARLVERLGPALADPALATLVDRAVADYRDAVTTELAVLLGADIDAQRTTPLSILREAVALLHPPLDAAGVLDAERDELDRERDPRDRFALAPVTWSDLGPEVADAGITWGAAKAHVHLSRRRRGTNPGQVPGGGS